jgi:hypothetical protein
MCQRSQIWQRLRMRFVVSRPRARKKAQERGTEHFSRKWRAVRCRCNSTRRVRLLRMTASFALRVSNSEPQLVDQTGQPNHCAVSDWTLFSHKPSSFHRGFGRPCGTGGKYGTGRRPQRPDFQNSSIAQPRFRKLGTCSTPYRSISSEGFPLFLPQLRVILYFLLSLLLFSYYPSRLTATLSKSSLHSVRLSPGAGLLEIDWEQRTARGRRIQKSALFSTHTGAWKMNTIKTERETGTSAKPQCVVECGQRRNVFLGRGWGYADHGNRS